MKTLLKLCLILPLLAFTSCEVIEFRSTEPVGIVEGVRPIYVLDEDWDHIFTSAPQPIENLGKIYYKDPYIYVSERYKGIHILDNTNPENPIPLRFIHVPGSEDIAIKGNILYTDNLTDLVAIDISNTEEITITSRIRNLYTDDQKTYPDGYSGYFECVDPDKGKVLGWEEATLDNPNCLR